MEHPNLMMAERYHCCWVDHDHALPTFVKAGMRDGWLVFMVNEYPPEGA